MKQHALWVSGNGHTVQWQNPAALVSWAATCRKDPLCQDFKWQNRKELSFSIYCFFWSAKVILWVLGRMSGPQMPDRDPGLCPLGRSELSALHQQRRVVSEECSCLWRNLEEWEWARKNSFFQNICHLAHGKPSKTFVRGERERKGERKNVS